MRLQEGEALPWQTHTLPQVAAMCCRQAYPSLDLLYSRRLSPHETPAMGRTEKETHGCM